MKNKTICIILFIVTLFSLFTGCKKEKEVKVAKLLCEIESETYMYNVVYNEKYKVLETSDIEWFNDNIDKSQYKDDALQFIAYVEEVVIENNGSVKHFPTETEVR